MYYVTGETVYRYTLRNGKLFIHEGDVIMDRERKYVRFGRDSSRMRYPKANEFGVVYTGGPSLWLTSRDDKLAARLFIEFEEQKLVELHKQIDVKTELIKTLKDSV